MKAPRQGGIPRWLFYFAVAASWLFGAEIVILTAARRSLPGRLPSVAGWLFVGAIAVSILAIARLEMMSRRRSGDLLRQLEEALGSITALTEASLTSLELPELLERSLERLVNVLQTNVAVIFMISATGTELDGVAAIGVEEMRLEDLRISIADNDGLVSRVIVTELPVATVSPIDLEVISDRVKQQLVSAAACPIIVEGRLIGVCVTGTTAPKRFDERELHLMQLVADRAGLGIERRRLDDAERLARQDVERAHRYAIVLATTSAALATARDSFDPQLSSLVDIVVPSFSDWCAVDLIDTNGVWHRVAIRHLSDIGDTCSIELQRRVPMISAMTFRAIESHETQRSAGFIAAESAAIRREPARPVVDPTPWLIVPLETQSYWRGAITFGFDGPPGGAPESTIATALDIVRRASIAIDRVVLFQEAQDVAEHSKRVAQQLQDLLDASLQVARMADEAAVVAAIAGRALTISNASGATVKVFNPRIQAVSGVDNGLQTSRDLDIELPRDLGIELATIESPTRLDRALAAPIMGADAEQIGVMAIWRDEGDDFTPEDETVLVLLAQTTSTALGSVALYRTIQSSEARWRTLIETAPVGIVEVDVHGAVRWSNRSAQEIFATAGGTGAIDRDVQFAKLPQLESLWARAATGAEVREREILGVEIGDEHRDLLVSVVPLYSLEHTVHGILTLVSDISDRRRLENDLQQAQRMEALGQLAGNVAHDFGNLLTLISGYTELLRAHEAMDERLLDLVNNIQGVTDRAATLTNRLLTISRSQAPRPQVIRPAEALLSMRDVLAKILGDTIQLQYDFPDEDARVSMDPGYFDQVVLNLAINARDAMPDGGSFTMRLHGERMGATQATRLGVTSGEVIELVISDTGTGMTPDVAEHCFEPFYTTKGPQKGTGLGLAAVRSVITESGGAIHVHSELGIGTSFVIYLPAVHQPVTEVAQLLSSAPEPPPRPEKRGSTVLVAEDDDTLRALVKKVLSQAGYEVLSAAAGDLALEVAETWQGAIDLLVSDVAMPGLEGPELARELSRIRPQTPVLFISTNVAAIDRLPKIGAPTSFLAKPFRPSELLDRVAEMLSTSAARDQALSSGPPT